jgi:eukaryotic-like serine/threonine-protein kinase
VVARIVTQLARTLADAHTAGLTHGDLKPDNVFVRTSPAGHPIAAVSDFGQALLTPAAATMAACGDSRAGGESWAAQQLLFAAPEQLAGQTTPAGDQYGLAALAYLLLTGAPPFSGETPAIAAAIMRQPPVPPSQRNPNLPREVDEALLRGLAKDPAERFPTIVGFAGALDDALGAATGAGVSQAMAELGSGRGRQQRLVPPTAGGAPGARTADVGGVRLTMHAPRAARQDRPHAPADTPRSLRRPLAIVAAIALVFAIITTALAFRAMDNTSVVPQLTRGSRPTLGSGGQSPNPTVGASGRDAERQLGTVTAQKPAYTDKLATANGSHWSTDGKAIFFGAGGLHLRNGDPRASLLVAAPADTSALHDVAVKTDITLAQSNPGNFAGVRFFVVPGGGNDSNYYCYTISLEGRYVVWLHQGGQWTFITSGYSAAIKPGLNQTNTLAVLARSSTSQAYLFANGKFVAALRLNVNGPTAGGAGLIVLDSPTEAIFANFAVYNAA